MTREATRIAAIIALAGHNRTSRETAPATVGGTREPVSACSTLASSARPGTTDTSQRATALRCASGSSASATATTNPARGTRENNTRYEIAADSCDIAWRE